MIDIGVLDFKGTQLRREQTKTASSAISSSVRMIFQNHFLPYSVSCLIWKHPQRLLLHVQGRRCHRGREGRAGIDGRPEQPFPVAKANADAILMSGEENIGKNGIISEKIEI